MPAHVQRWLPWRAPAQDGVCLQQRPPPLSQLGLHQLGAQRQRRLGRLRCSSRWCRRLLIRCRLLSHGACPLLLLLRIGSSGLGLLPASRCWLGAVAAKRCMRRGQCDHCAWVEMKLS